MPKPKSKEFVDSESESSGSWSEKEQPKAKKSKKEPEQKKSKKQAGTKSTEQENKFELSKTRFVTVQQFHGKKLVNIREYYEKDDELKPGKKGIALSEEQWKKLKEHESAIDEALEAL